MVPVRDVLREFDAYMANGSDALVRPQPRRAILDGPIAYFCAEYGFYESLGIYSGGLGVLAGDHTEDDVATWPCRSSAVGLLYRHGYFHQTIDADGHQEHAYPDYDLTRLPVARVQAATASRSRSSVELPGRDLQVAVWLAQVGRMPLLLLDTDIPDNGDADRPITHILYVRGREMRLHQELVLGVGGVRALRALGIEPSVWHLNEGHSAFLLAERARELRRDRARRSTRPWTGSARDSVFTIHTPVSAGNERFDADLVRRVAGPAARGRRAAAHRRRPAGPVLELGLGVDGDPGQFDMTAFSLRLTRGANAVSQLHAETANATWRVDRAARDPGGVTNGVHTPSWVGQPMGETLANGVGADLDHLDAESARRPVLGAPRPRSRPTSCGRRTSARSWSWRSSPGAACGASSPATARRRRCSTRSRRRSTRTS